MVQKSQEVPRIDDYLIGKTLGEGGTSKVKFGTDKDGNSLAIKVMNSSTKNEYLDILYAEVQALKGLEHPNIVKVHGWNDKGQYIDKNGRQKPVAYIALELITGGELFDWVTQTGAFDEEISRFYFSQILDVLEFMHGNNQCHRDLKLENLFLDENFDIKIADFGFVGPAAGRDGQGYLFTELGTQQFMAPEIHMGRPYSGKGVDLFASTVILFMMLTARPPFRVAQFDDAFYNALVRPDKTAFWKTHSSHTNFSDDFKDLFESIMHVNPVKRPNLQQVKAHKWMQGPVATLQEIKNEFTSRNIQADEKITKELSTRSQELVTRSQQRKICRGENEKTPVDVYCEEKQIVLNGDQEDSRQLQPYFKEYKSANQFWSLSYPGEILRELIEVLMNHKEEYEFKVKSNEYKVTITLLQFKDMKIVCEMLKDQDDESKTCVDFCRRGKNRDVEEFKKHYDRIMEQLKNFENCVQSNSYQ